MSSDEDQQNLTIKVVAALFMSIACVAVMLRCYVRGWVVKAFGWDDGTMVAAMGCYAIFSGTMIGAGLHGNGRHWYSLEPEERVVAMKYWWFCEIAFCFASIFCKISICIFLMRICIKRIHLWTLYSVMVATALTGLVFMLLMCLQCKQLSFFWTRMAHHPVVNIEGEGSCINMEIIVTMTYIYSAFAAICDLTVGILPVFVVHQLQMKRQTKMAVVGILSMACIASSAVIVRIPFVKNFNDLNDFLYATVQIACWSNLEVGLGITAGSVATLRPLVRKWFGSRVEPSYSVGLPKDSFGRYNATSRQRSVLLGSMNETNRSEFRPDNLDIMVTNIESQRVLERPGPSYPSSSQERLTLELPSFPGKMEVSIYQTFEVTRAAAGSDDVDGSRRIVREHV